MSKYNALWNYIEINGAKSNSKFFKLTFEEVEKIAGVPLDHSFLTYKKELEKFGWKAGKISMKEKTISFEKSSAENFQPKKFSLRKFKRSDARTILSWLRNEREFRQWSTDRYSGFPITPNDMNVLYSNSKIIPLTFLIGTEIAGHITIRFPNENQNEARLGFVIVDGKRRGEGLGKTMIQLALEYISKKTECKKVSLGVFENNQNALNCYKSCGFKEAEHQQKTDYFFMDENWNCIEMEISMET